MAAQIDNTYTGDGQTKLYSFTFPYINEDDVRVRLDRVTIKKTKYEFANATQILFDTAPGDGVEIQIYRDTNIESIPNTFYPGSAIRARDLNDNFTSSLYVIQEADKYSTDAIDASLDALTTSERAEGKIDDAVVVANDADANATTALNTANAADFKADTAITDSAAAVTTANAAVSAISDVVTYTLVANVAAIPGSPSTDDRIEVSDSTGIESFSPLIGLPDDFEGDSGKSVRIVYGGATWEFLSYVISDPDSRYAAAAPDTTAAEKVALNTTSKVRPILVGNNTVNTATTSAIRVPETTSYPTINGNTGNITAPNFTGNLTGDVTGDLNGDVTGDTTGTHNGPVNGDLNGTADRADSLQVSPSGFGSASNRPIACFGTSSTPTADSYSSIKYATTNVPTVSGSGLIKAPGGFEGDLDGNASTATNADKVDGLHAEEFLRSNTNTTANGNVTFANKTFFTRVGNAAKFNDDSVLSFGSGTDAEIFCNGSDLYLDLNSSIGNFYIRDGENTRYTFNDNGNFTATGNIEATGTIEADGNIESANNLVATNNVNAGNKVNASGDIVAGGNISAAGTLSGTLGKQQVRNAIALGITGEPGTYAMLRKTSAGDANPGDVVDGFNLLYANVDSASTQSPSGRWQCMGFAEDSTAEKMTTLWLRVE